MTRSFHDQSCLINTSAKIDVDGYWWWKIHGVRWSIPRATISVPSLAVGLNPMLVTRTDHHSLSLLQVFRLFLSPTFSIFLLDHSLLTHLSPPTWAIARCCCCCWWTSLGQGPPPKTCTTLATLLGLVTADLVHGQCYTWCEPTVARRGWGSPSRPR